MKIALGIPLFDPKGVKYTHNVTSFSLNPVNDTIRVVIEKGLKVQQINIPAEEAISSGLINISVLEKYLK